MRRQQAQPGLVGDLTLGQARYSDDQPDGLGKRRFWVREVPTGVNGNAMDFVGQTLKVSSRRVVLAVVTRLAAFQEMDVGVWQVLQEIAKPVERVGSPQLGHVCLDSLCSNVGGDNSAYRPQKRVRFSTTSRPERPSASRPDVGRLWGIPFRGIARPDQRHDPSPDGYRERGPRFDEGCKVGIGRVVCCANCCANCCAWRCAF